MNTERIFKGKVVSHKTKYNAKLGIMYLRVDFETGSMGCRFDVRNYRIVANGQTLYFSCKKVDNQFEITKIYSKEDMNMLESQHHFESCI